jgi:hypothetical protein
MFWKRVRGGNCELDAEGLFVDHDRTRKVSNLKYTFLEMFPVIETQSRETLSEQFLFVCDMQL